MDWIYSQPVRIIFGRGKIKGLRDLCAGAELLFSDISPNPDVSEVNSCAKFLRDHGADVLIALGGGSAMDLAKAASLLAEDISDYHGTGKAVPVEHLPVIAVPTTSGTGSEVTCVSVRRGGAPGKRPPSIPTAFIRQPRS